MDKLELYTSELLMLKGLLEYDMETSSCGDINFYDVNLMQHYLDRAKVLVKVQELLGL
jgi:hypothetical protein